MQPSGSLSNQGTTTLHRTRQAPGPLFMHPRHLDRNMGIKRPRAPYFTAGDTETHPPSRPAHRFLFTERRATPPALPAPCLVPTLASSRLHSPCEQIPQFPTGGQAIPTCLGGQNVTRGQGWTPGALAANLLQEPQFGPQIWLVVFPLDILLSSVFPPTLLQHRRLKGVTDTENTPDKGRG